MKSTSLLESKESEEIMKKEIFDVVLKLSCNPADISYEIEKFMEILLQDTSADLNILHEDLMFFMHLNMHCPNNRREIGRIRSNYLKSRYSAYFENKED